MENKEYLGKKLKIKMDRPLGTKHPKFDWKYPINCGYVPNTVSGDGEELDAYLIGVDNPLEEYEGVCIAIIHRINDNEDKLVVAPIGSNYTDEEIRTLTEFQEKWYTSDIIR